MELLFIDHIHDHPHTHMDGHSHDHTHPQSAPNDIEQTKALLAYMVDHNEHHAEELANLLDSLPEKAQKRLSMAIGTFEAANVELQDVLESLG